MATNLSSRSSLFSTARQIRNLPSSADVLNELVDLVLESISKHHLIEARNILGSLKSCIASIKPRLDKYPDEICNNAVEVTLLQKENCELRLELARLRKDDEETLVYEELLKGFDEFFSQAISDLDPDRG